MKRCFEVDPSICCEVAASGVPPNKVRRGAGFAFGEDESGTTPWGLKFNKGSEAKALKECMDTWQKSSRCCPSSCGDVCGIVILNHKDSGHCRNVLFEKCSKHGGDGHDNLIQEYTGGEQMFCKLIYGYSVQGGRLRLNSGTFNGNTMPDEMRTAMPSIFASTRRGKKIRHSLR